MSVPANLRSVPKLEVLKNARQIVIHTIKIITNENNFPKRYRWCFANKLIDETMSMYKNLLMANSVNVRTTEDKILRRNYQMNGWNSLPHGARLRKRTVKTKHRVKRLHLSFWCKRDSWAA